MKHLYDWWLIICVVLAIWAVWALMGIIEGAIDGWREVKECRRNRRLKLRENINQIIEQLCDEDDPGLDRALQDSIIEYRVLC